MSIYVDVAARYVAVHNLNCALIIEIRDDLMIILFSTSYTMDASYLVVVVNILSKPRNSRSLDIIWNTPSNHH